MMKSVIKNAFYRKEPEWKVRAFEKDLDFDESIISPYLIDDQYVIPHARSKNVYRIPLKKSGGGSGNKSSPDGSRASGSRNKSTSSDGSGASGSRNKTSSDGSGGDSGKVDKIAPDKSDEFLVVKIKYTEPQKIKEIEILEKIEQLHDSNIMKPMCYFWDSKSTRICYKYFKNQSLDRLLQRKVRISQAPPSPGMKVSEGPVVLNWPQRLRIARGVAQGLYHMHCKSIFHMEVKSSNILIDDSLDAKIANFKSAKSIKYEQALADNIRKDEKLDVYGFGVILLELIKGKPVEYNNRPDRLVEWARRVKERSLSSPIGENDLDKDVEQKCLKEINEVFRVAVCCTGIQTRRDRYVMKDALDDFLAITKD